jgi:hypothetical protein
MRWFTALPGQVIRFAVSDGGVWVTAWIAVALACGLLILIASQLRNDTSDNQATTRGLSTSEILHHVRRHSRRGGAYPQDVGEETVVLPGLPTSHWAISNTPWHDSEHPVDAPSRGRRHAENLVRTIVPRDWRPPIGDIRIALIETPTSQYAVIHRTRSNVVRPYVVGSTA